MENSEMTAENMCKQVREELRQCLLNSNCVKRDKKTLQACLSITDGSVPMNCQLLRNKYFQCKNFSFRGREH